MTTPTIEISQFAQLLPTQIYTLLFYPYCQELIILSKFEGSARNGVCWGGDE